MRSTIVAAALLAAPSVVSAVTCYKGVYILSARGTNELRNKSSLIPIGETLTVAIPDSYYEEIDYPASTQFVASAVMGVIDMRTRLIDYYNSCPDGKTVLLGYSQGAIVIDLMLAGGTFQSLKSSDLTQFIPNLADLENVTVPALLSPKIGANVAAIATWGDGTWASSQGSMPLCNKCTSNATLPLRPLGSQFYSNMESYASRLQDNCHADDPLCCTTGTNGLAHLSYFDIEASNAAVQFIKQKYAAIAGSSASAYAATVTVSSAKSCVSIFGNNTPSSTSGASSATATGGSSQTTSTGTAGASSSGASRTSSGAPVSATGAACRAVVGAGQAVGALAAALCAGSLLM